MQARQQRPTSLKRGRSSPATGEQAEPAEQLYHNSGRPKRNTQRRATLAEMDSDDEAPAATRRRLSRPAAHKGRTPKQSRKGAAAVVQLKTAGYEVSTAKQVAIC